MEEIVARIKTELDGFYDQRKIVHEEIRRRERALSALQGTNGIKTYDPEKAAGKQNIEDVAVYLQTRGEARQVEITRDLNKNSGTVSCALQVLEKRELVEAGPRIDRSVEWKWVGPAPEKNKIRRAKVAA